MGKKQILVVDDSATVRQQLRLFLEKNGYQVDEAENGRQGVSRAGAEKYDLILVDVNMPEMDGISMVREVRKLPAHAKTPVFALTTESTQSVIAEGKTAGFTAWIVKPFKPDVLLKGISKVLGS